jgi:hypothetical protein
MPEAATAKPAKVVKRRGRPSLSRTVLAKIKDTQTVVRRTMTAAQRYKSLDICGPNELASCVHGLEAVFSSLAGARASLEAPKRRVDSNQVLNTLQEASTALSALFKTFGTERMRDLVHVCFGSAFEAETLVTAALEPRYGVMCEHCHPIGYKVVEWRGSRGKPGGTDPPPSSIKKNRIVEDFMIAETAACLDCFDLARTSKGFHSKVRGIKFAICDATARKTLIVCALVDDVPLHCLDQPFVVSRMSSLRTGAPGDPDYTAPAFERFLAALTLKDILVYNDLELYDRYTGAMTQAHLIKQRTIAQATREFLGAELYGQRTMLMNLLLKADEHEFQYLAYLLYDLLSTDSSGGVDAQEQTLLFDSLPWAAKKHFHEAMRETVKYTSSLANFDATRVPLEQQICLLKASDAVKEKAMLKLREVKAKSEDSGSKARQYLEGLLRIPFGAYRVEPALDLMATCTHTFGELMNALHGCGCPLQGAELRDRYTSLEVRGLLKHIESNYSGQVADALIKMLSAEADGQRRAGMVDIVNKINGATREHGVKGVRIPVSGKTAAFMREKLVASLQTLGGRPDVLWSAAQAQGLSVGARPPTELALDGVAETRETLSRVSDFMRGVRSRLDDSVHGHERAKRQLERIVGQWVNGEQTGYCFGFEGPPGVGKTSLAKHGVARCLCDTEGTPRPFAFVAIGGSSNGSTLEGHNYTYVGSTWGRIVDVLMEKKCMNPIIFIDELDKVSRTEHGRELVGILTHLVDPTQNDAFQDKYFNGVDLDLSRALFVFSYNDVDAIDRVLLDRIHRVKFEHLTMQDKLAVARKFLFPEIYGKMGLIGMVNVSDAVLEHIIEQYTSEAGVRKLKELLFEIVGEINLSVLGGETPASVPVVVTVDDLAGKYLKGRKPTRITRVTPGSSVGVITGLWANHHGQGGVLPVEARWRPADTALDLKLTGMQGDVMKESMAVACTLACELVPGAIESARSRAEGHRGLHVHVPEGATPKDGPSAGAAITTALYSLLSGTPVKNDVAVTGEICLRGKVTAIGGLDLKIAGGVRAGIKHFMFPKDNESDLTEMQERYADTDQFDGIEFTAVETINDVLAVALVDDQ